MHGDTFGTAREHEIFLAAADLPDPTRAALGLGYRAGLACAPREPDPESKRRVGA
jgi:hypothetical protein